MKGYVLDSWTVLAWLQGEQPAASRVERLLARSESRKLGLWMCILNLGEVFHTVSRTRGPRVAAGLRRRLLGLPVGFVSVDDDLVWEAADLKARHAVSCADAFCASLARRKRVPVLTGDPDFATLERQGRIDVSWLERR